MKSNARSFPNIDFSKLTKFVKQSAENWSGPDLGFENAPEISGADNPDSLEIQDTDATEDSDKTRRLIQMLEDLIEAYDKAKAKANDSTVFGWGTVPVERARELIAEIKGNEVQPFDAEEAELSARPEPVPGGEFADDGPDSPYKPSPWSGSYMNPLKPPSMLG